MKQFLLVVAALLIGIYIARRNPPAPVVIIERVEVTPIPKATPTPHRVTYRAELKPSFSSLMKAERADIDLGTMGPETARLRDSLNALPWSEERDAALRLCSLVQRGVAITLQERARFNRESPRSAGGGTSQGQVAEQTTEAKDQFFKAAIEKQWKEKLAPLQIAAQAEWDRIPASAALE